MVQFAVCRCGGQADALAAPDWQRVRCPSASVHRTPALLGRVLAPRTSRVRGPDVGRTRWRGEQGRPVRVVLRLVHAWGAEAQPVGSAVQAPAVLARAASADTAAARGPRHACRLKGVRQHALGRLGCALTCAGQPERGEKRSRQGVQGPLRAAELCAHWVHAGPAEGTHAARTHLGRSASLTGSHPAGQKQAPPLGHARAPLAGGPGSRHAT
jgi:hypothetical protein